jgi:hypothetical protein
MAVLNFGTHKSMNLLRSAKSAVANAVPVRPRRIPFGPAHGLMMNMDLNWDAAFFFGIYETELNEHYRALVKPGMRCFDVGSHRGWDSLIFYNLNGGADVVAFESGPENRIVSEANVRLNGYEPKTVLAYVTRDDEEGHISLDTAASRFFVPDFIKMDIEGAEADALEGAAKILSERMPSLVIEIHGEAVEKRCQAILAGHGYTVLTVDQRPAMILKETRGAGPNRWLVAKGRPV